MNPTSTELQKIDFMIDLWREINNFSNRVLTLHIKHRKSLSSQIERNKKLKGANNRRNNNNNNNHRNNGLRLSTGNDTSSDSDSEDDDDDDDDASASEDDSNNNNNHRRGRYDRSSFIDDGNDSDNNDSDYTPSNNKSKKNHSKSRNNNNNNGNKKKKTTKGRCSGYNIYFGVRCKEIQKNEPELEFATISRNIGTEWKHLTKAQQKKWNDMAAKLTQERKEQAELKQKMRIKQEEKKKRKLGETHENHNNCSNENDGMMNEHEPPNKKMRNNSSITSPQQPTLAIPKMGFAAGFNPLGIPLNTGANPTMHMAAPALSLLSEALKKMPSLQTDSTT